jgi:hypothetical protein
MDLKRINKHLFLYVGIIVVLIVAAIIVLLLLNGGTKLSYSQVEQRLKDAAVKYYTDNSALLPSTDGAQVSVSAYDLEEGNYISQLQKMVKGEAICSGEVKVTKNGDYYLYATHLNCGNDYNSSELHSVVVDEKNVVTTGDGLYLMNNEYVFRGENVNNYVSFANKLWRIVKVDQSNYIKLLSEVDKPSQAWDNRFNVEHNSNVGINDYKVSRIKDYVFEMYNDKEFFSDNDRTFIAYKDICVGKRKLDQTKNDNSIECSTILEHQPISLLQVNEYINASIDSSCKKIEDSQCQNYNYLSSYNRLWWSLTADSTTTYKAYKISSGGVSVANTSSMGAVRPAIYLSNAVMFNGGDGTKQNPYVVK